MVEGFWASMKTFWGLVIFPTFAPLKKIIKKRNKKNGKCF